MESNSSKSQFIQQLIDDSLKYQMLYKAEKNKNNLLEATVKKLQTTIAEKESEIKDLKQKNIKHLMEIGVQVSRYNTFADKYKQLEKDVSDLSIKYDELLHKLNKNEQIHIQNLRVIINEYYELKKFIEHNNELNFLCEFK